MLKIKPENIEGEEWVPLGYIPVDSGQIIIGDPCSIDDYHDKETRYDGLVEAGTKTFKNNRKIDINLTLSTGIGDGYYPVIGRIVDLGRFGKRLAEIHIEFITDESGDEES